MITAEADYLDRQTGRPRIVKRIPPGEGVIYEVYRDNCLFLRTSDKALAYKVKRDLAKGRQPVISTTYVLGAGI